MEKRDFFDRFFLMESWHRISHSETLKACSALCFALCFRTYVRWILKKHWFFGKPPTLRPSKPQKIWKSRKTKKCCGDDFRWTSFLPKTFFWYLFKKSFNLRKFRFQKNVIVRDVQSRQNDSLQRECQTLRSCKISFRRDLSKPFCVVKLTTQTFKIRPSCIFWYTLENSSRRERVNY